MYNSDELRKKCNKNSLEYQIKHIEKIKKQIEILFGHKKLSEESLKKDLDNSNKDYLGIEDE